MRKAETFLAGIALSLVSGCADRELAHQGVRVRLIDRLDSAEIEVPRPLPLSGIVEEVVWVRGGLANVVITLRRDDGVGGEARGRVLTRWGLPLLPAPPEAGGPDLPELIGVPLPRIEQTASRSTPNGFWIQGTQLGIVHVPGHELPEELRLRYTVYAAQLAGHALGAGFDRTEMFSVRARRGPISGEALALPTGSIFRATIPPTPGGRFEGSFRAVSQAQGEDTSVHVRLTIDGETVFEDEVVPGPISYELGASNTPWVDLPSTDASREVELEVSGSPGGLAFFENAGWSRARSWREGPNVLLLVVSGLRPDRLGCYGFPGDGSPSIDELATKSMIFSDAWATAPWALPSIATILTSTWGSQHLATRHDRRLGRGVTTVAEVFRDMGYRTAAFTDGGFYTPVFGLDRGYELFDAQGGGAGVVFDRAVDFLRENGDRPWFLTLQVGDLLPPYIPSDAAREEVELRHPKDLQNRPPHPAAYRAIAEAGQPVPGQAAHYLFDLYQAELVEMDEHVGALLAKLEELDLYSDCVIALTSDHGQEFAEHGFLGYGDTLYPEVMRVPLMIKMRLSDKTGLEVTEAVSLIDLAPTLLDAAQASSRIAGTTFEGQTLLQGKRPTPVFASREHPVAGPIYGMRHDRNLFIEGRSAFHLTPAMQMFDLVADPDVKRDVSRQQAALSKLSSSRINKQRLEYPARVEGTEVALSPSELKAFDPLPGAKPPRPAPTLEERQGAGRGQPGAGDRQPRRNR